MQGLHVPTTTKASCRAALMSPDCTVKSAWRDRVVGRFLHVSAAYFFNTKRLELE